MVGQELSLQPQPSDLPTGTLAATAAFRFAGNGPIKPPDRQRQRDSRYDEYNDSF
jgi:hypothetical protein